MSQMFIKGQKFVTKGMDDRLEITEVTRYRVYYRITLVRGSGDMNYSARYTFETFPATYIEGMLGKSEFRKALDANLFVEVDNDWRPMNTKGFWTTEKIPGSKGKVTFYTRTKPETQK